jgi:mRNA interferase RelE/StbE
MIVEFDKSFEKSLNKVHDNTILRRLKRIIIQIENSPSLSPIPNLIKLTGYSSYYRIRIGDYRIGIELINTNTVRFVIIVAHRKNIYKIFP